MYSERQARVGKLVVVNLEANDSSCVEFACEELHIGRRI